MYYIKILDLKTKLSFEEKYESYYDFRKRVVKLQHSNKLKIISRSNFED